VDARGARAPRSGAPALGQHLVPRSLAAELVRRAHIEPSDLVVEIGAGTGTITAALAARARVVIALELDRRFARQLRAAFASDPVVRIVEGDARSWPLPLEPFRAFGNLPFAITTDLLRHLVDDPLGAMVRADLVVQLEVARKRTQDPPRNVRSLVWGPWWVFTLDRRLPARCFRPPPRVDAAVLEIRRREPPLLAPGELDAYERLLRRLFLTPDRPVARSLRSVVGSQAGRVASDVGLSHRARPTDLRVPDAVRLFRRVRRAVGA
jgi:23S rRNA (adenine-N6)-dimethyltransferase